jgi:hypothetical protein
MCVLDLEVMNDAMMSKWLWNIENSNVPWQKNINEKYFKGKPLIYVKKKQSASYFWRKVLDLRDEFYKHCKMIIGNGRKISLWKNAWAGDSPLAIRFPCLFDLAHGKNI